MENNSKVYYKDIIFASSNSIEIRKTKKLLDNGLIRKIAPKIYSANLNDNPADIIRTNLFEILSHLYPGALLSHRSAIEFKPTSKN
ncbi:MAG: cell filamentation protein Fic, partial [Bacteroidales bacterium]